MRLRDAVIRLDMWWHLIGQFSWSVRMVSPRRRHTHARVRAWMAEPGYQQRSLEVGRLHVTSGTERGRALNRRPWAEAFANEGGRQHCPDCRETTAERQRARARADNDGAAEIEECFAAHAVQSHPHMRRLWGD